MKGIIIQLHYHSKFAGVYSVIQNIFELYNHYKKIYISSQPFHDDNIISWVVPINYNTNYNKNVVNKIAEEISKNINQLLSENKYEEIIFIAHNLSLIRNINLNFALKQVINKFKDIKFFFFHHDFFFDGRLKNLKSYVEQNLNIKNIIESFLFDSDNLNYIVLSKFDKNFLNNIGIDDCKIQIFKPKIDINIENNIEENFEFSEYILMPFKFIRRKNIYESTLLAYYIDNSIPIVITLKANSEQDVIYQNKGLDYFNRLNINIKMPSKSYEKSTVYNNALFIFNPSIKEGFGFAYREPIFYKKNVLYRKLPYLDDLPNEYYYNYIYIPIDDKYKDIIKKLYLEHIFNINNYLKLDLNYEDFNIVKDNLIDFGHLDSNIQLEIIQKIALDKSFFHDIININKIFFKKVDTILNVNETVKFEYNNTKILKFCNNNNHTNIEFSSIMKSIRNYLIEKSIYLLG